MITKKKIISFHIKAYAFSFCLCCCFLLVSLTITVNPNIIADFIEFMKIDLLREFTGGNAFDPVDYAFFKIL